MAANNPQILTQVNILSPGQFRALTVFEQPAIEEYLNGGSLGDIPHDAVATMPRVELEDEARRLRKTVDDIKDAHKKVIKEMSAELETLRLRDDYAQPPTEQELKERKIAGTLEELRRKLFEEIYQTRFHCDACLRVIEAAQRIEGVTFLILEKWAREEYAELAGFQPMLETLDEALLYITPEKEAGDGSTD